jgi:hypothetical protein
MKTKETEAFAKLVCQYYKNETCPGSKGNKK